MSIPEDVMKMARAIGDAWFGVGHHDSAALAEQVARAILAERERAYEEIVDSIDYAMKHWQGPLTMKLRREFNVKLSAIRNA